MQEIKIIRTSDEFLALKSVWQDLETRCNLSHPFLSWEWHYSWWMQYKNSFKPEADLQIFCLYNSDQLLAILPLMIIKKSGLKILQLLSTEIEPTDYMDILATEEHRDFYLQTIIESVQFRILIRSVDYIWIKQISDNSALFHIFASTQNSASLKTFIYPSKICPFIDLPQTEDEFLKQLSQNMRSGLKRQINKINKSENFHSYIISDPAQIEPAVNSLFRLHQARFEDKNKQTGFLPRRMEFHMDLARLFLEKGWLKLFVLQDNDKDFGVLYCYQVGGKMMYVQGGFDPDYQAYAPGNYLLMRAIRTAIENHLPLFDFMRGDESYKSKWTNLKLQLYDLYIPSSLRGMVFLVSVKFVNQVKKFLKKFLRK